MFEMQERAIMEEMQSLELQLVMMQRELARTNPNLAKARYKIGDREIDALKAIDLKNIAKLCQCSNRPMLGIMSQDVMTKLTERKMDFMSLDLLADKQ
jgi:hypothetical protein